MRVFHVEYAYMTPEGVVNGTRDFSYDTEQAEAESFCKEIKAKDGAVNIRIVNKEGN